MTFADSRQYVVDVRDKETLGRETQYGIEEMCRDSWNWQKNIPEGYPE